MLIHSINYPACKLIYDSDIVLGSPVYSDWFSIYNIFEENTNVIAFQGAWLVITLYSDIGNAEDSQTVWLLNSSDMITISSYPIVNCYSGASSRVICSEVKLCAKYNRVMIMTKTAINNISMHMTLLLRA